jgi:hypothetical protein
MLIGDYPVEILVSQRHSERGPDSKEGCAVNALNSPGFKRRIVRKNVLHIADSVDISSFSSHRLGAVC